MLQKMKYQRTTFTYRFKQLLEISKLGQIRFNARPKMSTIMTKRWYEWIYFVIFDKRRHIAGYKMALYMQIKLLCYDTEGRIISYGDRHHRINFDDKS